MALPDEKQYLQPPQLDGSRGGGVGDFLARKGDDLRWKDNFQRFMSEEIGDSGGGEKSSNRASYTLEADLKPGQELEVEVEGGGGDGLLGGIGHFLNTMRGMTPERSRTNRDNAIDLAGRQAEDRENPDLFQRAVGALLGGEGYDEYGIHNRPGGAWETQAKNLEHTYRLPDKPGPLSPDAKPAPPLGPVPDMMGSRIPGVKKPRRR